MMQMLPTEKQPSALSMYIIREIARQYKHPNMTASRNTQRNLACYTA